MAVTKNVVRVELVRENCDVVKIDAEDIERIYMNGLQEDLYVDMFGSYIRVQWADTIFMKLLASANKEHYEHNSIDLEKAVFEVLDIRDLVALDIFFDDGSNEYIQVRWSSIDDDYSNEYQENYIDEDNNLYIGVGKDIDLKGFFNIYYQD